jgi:hypothetical protein
MSESKVFHYVFVWHSFMDARSCLKCGALNGREYRDQDLFSPVLVDPEFGPIWDLNQNRSLMHGASGTCRCFLEVTVESINLENLEGYKEFWQIAERMS